MNTIQINTSDLIGEALNWAVATCEGHNPSHYAGVVRTTMCGIFGPELRYSTDWAQGGPIIEREKIATDFDGSMWCASSNDKPLAYYGPTLLIAAMRCYVASKLGDSVSVPAELV